MRTLRIQTPGRLHFGLLGWGPEAPRQFGGVGLMIDRPGIELSATPPPPRWGASGPLAERALQVAERVAAHLAGEGIAVPPAHLLIRHAPREHVGLGVGTQLSLAVAEAVNWCAGLPDASVLRLARLAGRGLRSGIGLHGYEHGGLIVDGGRRTPEGVPPLLAHVPLPSDWTVVVVIPERANGLHGPDELRAFAQLPPIPARTTDRLCRLVLLGLLPAVREHDLPAFGAALTELQAIVGGCFAPAQGGSYAHPGLESIVAHLRAEGLHGVGQSSWGPTLYGFLDGPLEADSALLAGLRERLGLGPESVFTTTASPSGRTLKRELSADDADGHR